MVWGPLGFLYPELRGPAIQKLRSFMMWVGGANNIPCLGLLYMVNLVLFPFHPTRSLLASQPSSYLLLFLVSSCWDDCWLSRMHIVALKINRKLGFLALFFAFSPLNEIIVKLLELLKIIRKRNKTKKPLNCKYLLKAVLHKEEMLSLASDAV